MNKIRLGRASPRCAGYFWRAASPAVAIARGTSVFSQSANAATAPGRSRDGWQLRDPGRVHRHQYRPKRHQREPRREPGHSCDRVRPGTNGTVINGTVINRTVHPADTSAASAQCAPPPPITMPLDESNSSIGGFTGARQTLGPGVYSATSWLARGPCEPRMRAASGSGEGSPRRRTPQSPGAGRRQAFLPLPVYGNSSIASAASRSGCQLIPGYTRMTWRHPLRPSASNWRAPCV
jgi:hypothetical protein